MPYYSGEELANSTLEVVQIFFDTATFDNIERDKKIKLEGQLSLIGGTMGLLTGFSIISGVEIIFYFLRSYKIKSVFKLYTYHLSSGWSPPSESGKLMLWLQPKKSFRTT